VLRLPLSGDLRLHEVGLFNVSEQNVSEKPGDKKMYLWYNYFQKIDSPRYEQALKVFKPGSQGHFFTLSADPCISPYALIKGGKTPGRIIRSLKMDVYLPPMEPVSIISDPVTGKAAYNTLILDMNILSLSDDNVLSIRLLDPAVPSHTWTHAEVRLDGFTGKSGRLHLALKFDPVCLVDDDRIWLELLSTDGVTVDFEDIEHPPTVTLRPETNWAEAEPVYAMKTLRPAIMTYGRSFEYIPWMWDNRMPDVDAPVNFGGQFDMAYPWQAVLKVNPGNKIANIYRAYTDITDPSAPPRQRVAYPFGRYPADMDNLPDKHYSAPRNAPDWAVYFREFQTFRNRIATWWRHHQRSDGQAGGGWNDDTLIFSRALGDMPLDSNPDALALYNNAFDGFDRTNYFKDGYCRIYPIDRLHNGDFVRERYKSLIYNLGDPRSATWAMEEAWHWGKPEKTPVNYGNGRAFLFGKDVLEWYWGKRRSDSPYRMTNLPRITEELRKSAAAANDTTLWRFTEAWCHSDDQSPYGVYNMLTILLGGWGSRSRKEDSNVTVTVGVGWIEGGGPDMARLVEYSGNDGLRVSMYSFSTHKRTVVARLYRLEPGTYTVTLKTDSDGNDSYETTVSEERKDFARFDRLSVTVPPKVPAVLDIKQIGKALDPGDLPDLAVSDYYVERKGRDVIVTVHNIGSAPSGPFTVSLIAENGEEITRVQAESIPGAEDFVPKQAKITLSKAPKKGKFTIIVDMDNAIREIFEENNVCEL